MLKNFGKIRIVWNWKLSDLLMYGNNINALHDVNVTIGSP